MAKSLPPQRSFIVIADVHKGHPVKHALSLFSTLTLILLCHPAYAGQCQSGATNNVIWADSYGADPTGTADSTTALNNAFNASVGSNPHRTLCLGAGSYKVNGLLKWGGTLNIDVEGQGQGGWNGTGSLGWDITTLILNNSTGIDLVGDGHVTIGNLRIISNSSGTGIFMARCASSTNCGAMFGVGSNGVGAVFNNVTFINSAGGGYAIVDVSFELVHFVDCHFYQAAGGQSLVLLSSADNYGTYGSGPNGESIETPTTTPESSMTHVIFDNPEFSIASGIFPIAIDQGSTGNGAGNIVIRNAYAHASGTNGALISDWGGSNPLFSIHIENIQFESDPGSGQSSNNQIVHFNNPQKVLDFLLSGNFSEVSGTHCLATGYSTSNENQQASVVYMHGFGDPTGICKGQCVPFVTGASCSGSGCTGVTITNDNFAILSTASFSGGCP